MATLDLNQEPDVEDVEVLPDLNEALAGDDHLMMHMEETRTKISTREMMRPQVHMIQLLVTDFT